MYVLMYNMPMPAYSIKLTVAAKGLKHFLKNHWVIVILDYLSIMA